MQKEIEKIFSNLEDWRFLPGYSLERRADIFFSIYLPGFIAKKWELNSGVHILPEFPVSKTAYMDYLIVSGNTYAYIELKTSMRSIDSKNGKKQQINYLRLEPFYTSLKRIFNNNPRQHPEKHKHLRRSIYKIFGTRSRKEILQKAANMTLMGESVYYLIPTKHKKDFRFKYCTFSDLRKYIRKHEWDGIGKVFYGALGKWAKKPTD